MGWPGWGEPSHQVWGLIAYLGLWVSQGYEVHQDARFGVSAF